MSEDEADLLLDLLESKQRRVVIPPTVRMEFDLLGNKKLDEAIKIETAAAKHTGKVFEPPTGAGPELEEYLAAIISATEQFRSRVRKKLEKRFARINTILNACQANDVPCTTRLQALTEGPGRYALRQPPGYEDAGKKTEDNRYNDLIIFFEMIHMAILSQTDVAFITNDSKEDWWEINQQPPTRTLLRGRRELSREFRQKAGRDFAIFHGLRIASDLIDLKGMAALLPFGEPDFQYFIAPWGSKAALSIVAENFDALKGTNKFTGVLRSSTRLITSAESLFRIHAKHLHNIAAYHSGYFGLGSFGNANNSYFLSDSSLGLAGLNQPAYLSSIANLMKTVAAPIFSNDPFRIPGIDLLNNFPLLGSRTFDITQATCSPLLGQIAELLNNPSRIPRIDPVVRRLDDLARSETPKRRRDAAALRRRNSRLRRSLRRRLRGRRINLIDPRLPLRRTLTHAKS